MLKWPLPVGLKREGAPDPGSELVLEGEPISHPTVVLWPGCAPELPDLGKAAAKLDHVDEGSEKVPQDPSGALC